MALAYLFDPNIQNQTLGGVNNVGGFLRVYIDGTDDRATTYKDFSGTLNKADIELDANGRAVVVVDDTKTYRMEVYSRDGFFMWSVTNLTARGSGGGSGDTVVVDGTTDEIDVTPNQVGGFMHYVVSLAAGIKSALSSLQETVDTLASSLRNKKDKQQNSDTSSTATKTLTRITQDTNGVIYPHFDDIDYTPANRNIAPEYSPSETYPIIGTPCMHEGVLYRSKVAINTSEEWTAAHWMRSIALHYDNELSSTSENAVKNKVLYSAFKEQIVLSATPYDDSIELAILNAVKRSGFLLFNGSIRKRNGQFSVNAVNNLFYINGITLAMDFRNYYGSAQLSINPGLFPCAFAGLKDTNLFYMYPTKQCDNFYFNACTPIN